MFNKNNLYTFQSYAMLYMTVENFLIFFIRKIMRWLNMVKQNEET